MPPRLLSAKQLADELGLGTRQIDNLVADGMPRHKRGRGYAYPWPIVLRWYIKHREASALRRSQPTDLNDARVRRETAEAQLKELELAKLEGRTVTIEDAEREIGATLDRLRARLVNIPGKWAPQLVGKLTVAAAKTALEGAVAEAMAALSKDGKQAEADADEPEGADVATA